MTGVAYWINQSVSVCFSALYWPLSFFGKFWSLVVLALAVGLLALWVFARISDQERIRQVKGRIEGNILAIGLFQNNLKVFFKIQGAIVGDTLRYLRLSIKPMVAMAPPLVLLLVQLDGYYSHDPVPVGQTALIKVKVADLALLRGSDPIALAVDSGLAVESKGVRIPSLGEVVWRIRVLDRGQHQVQVKTGGETVTKAVLAENSRGLIAATRTGEGFFATLSNPGEPPIASTSVIRSIEVAYPQAQLTVGGGSVDWLVCFLGLTVVFGFMLKGIWGVQI